MKTPHLILASLPSGKRSSGLCSTSTSTENSACIMGVNCCSREDTTSWGGKKKNNIRNYKKTRIMLPWSRTVLRDGLSDPLLTASCQSSLTPVTVKQPQGFLHASPQAGQAGEGAHCYTPCCSLSDFSSEYKTLCNSWDDGMLGKHCSGVSYHLTWCCFSVEGSSICLDPALFLVHELLMLFNRYMHKVIAILQAISSDTNLTEQLLKPPVPLLQPTQDL